MYVEAIDKETADKIVHVLCIAAKCPALQYYFLTDHVCNALGIKHYYNLTNPKKSVHTTSRLAHMLAHRRKVIFSYICMYRVRNITHCHHMNVNIVDTYHFMYAGTSQLETPQVPVRAAGYLQGNSSRDRR